MVRQVMRSRIEPMKKFARTLRAHRELILNYFRARKEFSSGVIEGLNNKAKVTIVSRNNNMTKFSFALAGPCSSNHRGNCPA